MTLGAPWRLRDLFSGSSGLSFHFKRKERSDGEVVVTVVREALEGLAEQGGTDPRVQLVEQVGEVQGGLDARQGLSPGEGRQPDRRPSLPVLLIFEHVIDLITKRPFRYTHPDGGEEAGPSVEISFKWDENAFRRVAEEAVANLAARQTRDLDELRQRLAGQPVDDIKPELERLFASYDGNITEPDLTDWAQLISDNTRIEMTPAPIDWEASGE